ncbi:hypothetical protein H0H81_001605 [Sphagnurus paluster]|uniref:FAD dependent oxidoreductase domain-containing protein n=1 Tax=Sphagnurus paluster TaxID=117069 RepID=A0A9P7FZX0_9AGAR|nr:hypothetical protein H0H81_001605 [Sphagnurus paluster]
MAITTLLQSIDSLSTCCFDGSVKVTAVRDLPAQKVANNDHSTPLLNHFIESYKELESYKNGRPVTVDGNSLSIAAVTAVSRYYTAATLDQSPRILARMNKSRNVITAKVQAGTSVYGVSTGFGGSADTRTDKPLLLGNALLQLLQSGVLPSSSKPLDVLPLLDPVASTTMPEAWVRGAILVRMNSLIRGHSGVRLELIQKMNELLDANITPVVPLRGSISASGDLSPLSYIAGTVTGNSSIRVFDGPRNFGARKIISSSEALAAHGIEPISLASKEHLGILNGTAFSASVAALALNDSVHLALLAQVCTAMGTEALAGTRGSFDPFIHDIARPHPGQIESAKLIWNLLEGSTFAVTHEEELSIAEDGGVLRQDRYPLRTSPQFIGPQIEDLLHSLQAITIECNSTTDNPLVDSETGKVHHGGNFQAMAVTNAMEKTRLALHHLGKLLFSQCTELVNPTMNRGLPPSLAATDPSLDYHCKGVDIASAAYVAELGYLASPVSTHIQSAEMHNQAVNSMALVSARATINSLEVLSMLTASYLYALCQALDLRALQKELVEGLNKIAWEELTNSFGLSLSPSEHASLSLKVCRTMQETLEATSTMDASDRMTKIAASSTTLLVDFFTGPGSFEDTSSLGSTLACIPEFRSNVASRGLLLLDTLRRDYLSGARGTAPATRYLDKTRPVYEFVRNTLGIRMHGSENYARFVKGLYADDQSVGQNVSLIHEAIRDVVRSSYSDSFYTKLARDAIKSWKNREEWGDTYHESGVVVLGISKTQAYADDAYQNDVALGAKLTPLANGEAIRTAFPPQVPTASFEDSSGYLNSDSGWANAGQGITMMISKVISLGGKVVPGKSVEKVFRDDSAGRTIGVQCHDGTVYDASLVIIATGSWTPSAFPDITPGYTSGLSTGQCLAMIQLSEEEAALYKDCPVVLDFASGFYIFPPTEKGIIKMAMHVAGYTNTKGGVSTPRTITTDGDHGLLIPKSDIQQLRNQLRGVYPGLARKPFSATRMCWYADVLQVREATQVSDFPRYNDSPDGNWIIGRVPGDPSLMLATAGNGHAYKVHVCNFANCPTPDDLAQFLPVIGRLVADVVQGTMEPSVASKFGIERDYSTVDSSRAGMLVKELDISQLCTPEDLLATNVG